LDVVKKKKKENVKARQEFSRLFGLSKP